jgi:hypothetical protein
MRLDGSLFFYHCLASNCSTFVASSNRTREKPYDDRQFLLEMLPAVAWSPGSRSKGLGAEPGAGWRTEEAGLCLAGSRRSRLTALLNGRLSCRFKMNRIEKGLKRGKVHFYLMNLSRTLVMNL